MSKSTFLAPAFEVARNGTKLDPEVAATFSSLSVVLEENSLDQFTLTLTNPFPDLPYTHGAKKDMFAVGSEITIKLGYVDALEKIFDGEVTGVGVAFAEQGATLTVTGHSRLHWLNGNTKTATFLEMTDSDIASKIANDAGLQPDVDRTDTKFPWMGQTAQTDLDFLRMRARLIGYEVAAEGKSLLFHKRPDGEAKSFTLVWGDEQRAFADSQALPLLRFTPTLNAKSPVTKVTVRGQHPTTREAITGTATSGDETDKSGTPGADVTKKAFGKPQELEVTDVPVASQEEADALAKALFNERAQGLVTGSGSTVGTPSIRARSVVDLEGIGPQFSGPYTITQSTHKLDSSGYSTSFNARRGSVGT
jgi:phage protein D